MSAATRTAASRFDTEHPHYKWVALSNTTLGMFMATIERLDRAHLAAGDLPRHRAGPARTRATSSYLLWMLMGYLLVTAVLVVTFGRLGDMYGRVRIYNLGFVVFTAGLGRAVARPAAPASAGRCG